MSDDDFIGIGAAARRFGLAESALRYWEKRGLLHPAQRRSSWRLYGPEQLHRIGLIKMWRESGLLSLDEIEAIISAGKHDWRDAVRDRLGEIERQQNRLANAKEHLEHLLTCTDENPAQDCPYLRKMTAEYPAR
ncbi:MerR family transcriptional regulator [Mycolicibacterium fortuitum]|uniref:MerR family transcriptional regulator n=1 Tax=Mycolicibacterium fortuitum TaxID=1766 RepID=UPI0007EA96B4|nr:MerR family transcriptional regulator [Mycolicibacterium fortuitum]MCA4726319.1 MerR family transcriptional regulator [Mycolicibacterium fortuitum]OBG47512.1 MerR family transcriptional regulator [Mycolicibacterium fortuitum]